MDELLVKKLLDLNKEIEKRKQEKSKLQGKLDMLMSTLQKETGCKTIEEAVEYRDNLSKQLVIMEDELSALLEEVESRL